MTRYRVLTLALATLTVLSTAAACSPADLSHTGLYLADGKLMITVLPCGADGVVEEIEIHLAAPNATNAAQDWGNGSGQSWSVYPAEAADPAQRDFEAFVVPTGWQERERTLTGMAGDERYAVQVVTDDRPNGQGRPVTFTLADLRQLADGELRMAEAGQKMLTVERREFERRVRKGCGD